MPLKVEDSRNYGFSSKFRPGYLRYPAGVDDGGMIKSTVTVAEPRETSILWSVRVQFWCWHRGAWCVSALFFTAL